jgi:HEAT repeat protein
MEAKEHPMRNRLLLAKTFLVLGVAMQGWLSAGPPTREEVARRAAVVGQLKTALAAEGSAAEKTETILDLMADEPDPNVRRLVLDAAIQAKGLDFDALLTKILADDADAGIRSRAATALGGLGSEKCLAALSRAAASDPTTSIQFGDIASKSSARRDAMFAMAALASRHKTLAEKAGAELRGLQIPEGGKDAESLSDARLQSLYQVTREEKLLAPFYERLQSKEAKTRVSGVVAFRFCGLKTVPDELLAAMNDEKPEVRSWAALVVGSIADPKAVPRLVAVAQDPKQELGPRCNAIHSLGRMRAAETLATLRLLLTDEQEAVQAQAAIAVYRITGVKVAQFPEGYNAE